MSSLTEKVYQRLKEVPEGKVTTYKDLALICETKAYRAVGQILKRNPVGSGVPCHRVVSSDGRLGGYRGKTDGKEIEEKVIRLRNEGIEIKGMKVNLERFGFRFQ